MNPIVKKNIVIQSSLQNQNKEEAFLMINNKKYKKGKLIFSLVILTCPFFFGFI
jgi:hypothetical protein